MTLIPRFTRLQKSFFKGLYYFEDKLWGIQFGDRFDTQNNLIAAGNKNIEGAIATGSGMICIIATTN